MANYLKILWERLYRSDVKVKAEVARIDVLQQAAARRRAEYAALTDTASPQGPLSLSRKQVEEAEAAYAAALQAWENKQSRQKSC